MTEVVDVAVIGAGVVGAAIARALAGSRLAVALLEARQDVGDATSKANTAILHTGFDATPGTLEARLVRRGHALLADYAARTGIAVERTGALLVAWTAEEAEALPALARKARDNGYDQGRLIGPDAVYRLVPALAPGALGGLVVPDESVICAWTTTLAYATDAVARGARLHLGCRVEAVRPGPGGHHLDTSTGAVRARWVINAAGLHADVLDRAFGHDRFRVTPRRGELLVFDKQARPLAGTIVLPVPTAVGKGVLISPTIYGNVMLGPTAEDRQDKDDTATSEQGFEYLLDRGARLMPRLLEEEVTASYAGLRAAIGAKDYLISLDAGQRYVLVGGIRSTGLTASMAIAEHVLGLLAGAGLDVTERPGLPAAPAMPNLGEAFPRPYRTAAMIGADPAYGRIVCFCERVTAGEITAALHSPIPPADLSGLRRRTRAMNGRCQGFYCGADVTAMFEDAR